MREMGNERVLSPWFGPVKVASAGSRNQRSRKLRNLEKLRCQGCVPQSATFVPTLEANNCALRGDLT
jgi:hypothetical protein